MDSFSPDKRSEIMRAVKSTENRSTEMRLIALFREWRVTGWRRGSTLPGKPDFVFPKAKVAVFVDGCFWHGCPRHCRIPQTDRERWMRKIQRNRKRDKTVAKELAERGWKVVRIWEHALRKEHHAGVRRRIRTALKVR